MCRDGLCLSMSSKNVFAWKTAGLKFSTEDRGIREINVLDNKNIGQKTVWGLMVSSSQRRQKMSQIHRDCTGEQFNKSTFCLKELLKQYVIGTYKTIRCIKD